MRILIAESKTMTECGAEAGAELLAGHRPRLDSIATTFMRGWGEWTAEEISGALKVSPALASEFLKMAYEFPNKATGEKALAAFTGVVFKALDYASLSPEEQLRADGCVDIISSLYGWLRGDDIVKPYRLDFTPRIAPTGATMANYWKPIVTPLLMESMENDGETEILDLLPADGAKCLDMRRLRRTFRVVKVDFRSVADGGTLKTPHSTLLKTLRGQLLREIIRQDIRSIDSLMSFESDKMYVDPDSDPATGIITMLVARD